MPSRSLYDQLQQVAAQNVCGVCGNHLVIATNPEIREWALRCGVCNVYDPQLRPTRHRSLLKRQKDGEPMTAIDRMQLERYLHKRIGEAQSAGQEPEQWVIEKLIELEGGTEVQQGMVVYKPVAQVTREDADRFINMAALGRMTREQKELALEIIQVTGLNPALREITIYEGQLYVMADGYRKLLNRSNTFDGMPEPRHVYTLAEKEAEGYAPDDVVVRIALQRKGQRFPVYGIGRANAKRPFRKNPIEVNDPMVMAEARAYRKAAKTGWQDMLSGYRIDFDPEQDEAIAAAPQRGSRVVDVPPPALAPPAPITAEQVKAIRAGREALKWDQERVQQLALERFGVEVRRLTAEQADQIIEKLVDLAEDAEEEALQEATPLVEEESVEAPQPAAAAPEEESETDTEIGDPALDGGSEDEEAAEPSEEDVLRLDQQMLAEVIEARGFDGEGIHRWISDLRNFGDSFEFLPHDRRVEAIDRVKSIVRTRNTYGAPQK